MKIDGFHLQNATLDTVEKLQSSLEAKVKSQPGYHFYNLWDKIYRWDIFQEAHRWCRRNGGAPGVGRMTFGKIDVEDAEVWTGKLQDELMTKRYGP